MKKLLFGSTMLLFTLALFGLLLVSPASAQDKATLNLNWHPNGEHVWVFTAQEKGFYKRANLELDIKRGFGSGDTLKKMRVKAAEFGIADLPAMIMARSKGTPVKSVGVIFAKGFATIYALKSSGIKTPKDLEGKTYGDAAGAAVQGLLPIFLQANGIKNMRWVPLSTGVKNTMLLTRQVDTIGAGITTADMLRDMAREKGDDLVVFYFSDYGVEVYGHGLVVHDDLITSNPGLIRRFVWATYEGTAWAIENPPDAVAAYVKLHPTQSRRAIESQWDKTIQAILDDVAKKSGIGYIDEKKMSYTIDTVTKLEKLPRRVASSEMYTNEFLPKLFPKVAR